MSQPHKNRRSFIHSLFWILFLVIGLCIISCSPKYGCPSHKGMAGFAWLKCRETGKVIITDMDGKIVCSYFDKPSK